MADYIIQKAVNIDAVNKKFQRTMDDYAASFEAQHKYDGCCAIITLNEDGTFTCQSRTGEFYPSLMGIAKQLGAALSKDVEGFEGIVLIGEAWWPGEGQFSAISGEFRRMAVSDKLQFIINDVLTTHEFETGVSYARYSRRKARLDGVLPERVSWATAYPPGSYGCPQALCNELVAMGAFDGLILRDPDGLWNRGRGTTGEIVKIKRVLSFDLRIKGWEGGKGKHEGRMGALVMDFHGKDLRVGTGFSDKDREMPPAYWLNQIGEVEAMDLSSEGLLREPRFKGLRFDKAEPDRIAA